MRAFMVPHPDSLVDYAAQFPSPFNVKIKTTELEALTDHPNSYVRMFALSSLLWKKPAAGFALLEKNKADTMQWFLMRGWCSQSNVEMTFADRVHFLISINSLDATEAAIVKAAAAQRRQSRRQRAINQYTKERNMAVLKYAACQLQLEILQTLTRMR